MIDQPSYCRRTSYTSSVVTLCRRLAGDERSSFGGKPCVPGCSSFYTAVTLGWLRRGGFVRAARKVTLSLSINSERYRDGICLCAFIAESPKIMSSGFQTSVPRNSFLGVKPVLLFTVARIHA